MRKRHRGAVRVEHCPVQCHDFCCRGCVMVVVVRVQDQWTLENRIEQRTAWHEISALISIEIRSNPTVALLSLTSGVNMWHPERTQLHAMLVTRLYSRPRITRFYRTRENSNEALRRTSTAIMADCAVIVSLPFKLAFDEVAFTCCSDNGLKTSNSKP